MKIVVLDGYAVNPGDLSWQGFEKLGPVKIYDRTPVSNLDEIHRRIDGAEIVLTNKTPIDKVTFEANPQLKYVGVLATGYNVVDLEAASQAGVIVTNIPAYGSQAVAQFTFALLLELTNRVDHHNQAVQAGRWAQAKDFCFWDYPAIELAGKTLGIIGFGRIGRASGQIGKAFGMKVLATGSRPNSAGLSIAEYVDLDTLLNQSDVIFLHCPLMEETYHIINTESIEKMKEGVILINTSRGPLIDESALIAGIQTGKIAGVGLDVVTEEPLPADSPLLGYDNLLITPHIAWIAKEARQRIISTAVENLEAYIKGQVINQVN